MEIAIREALLVRSTKLSQINNIWSVFIPANNKMLNAILFILK